MSRATQVPANANQIISGKGLSPATARLSRRFPYDMICIRRRSYYPGHAVTRPVWALPLSLATTRGITVVFFSCGYLDVSVPRVRLTLQRDVTGTGDGFPHSDIRGSSRICRSPRLFAAYHVLRRLPVPRHPPCALLRLTTIPHMLAYICGSVAFRRLRLPAVSVSCCVTLR